MLNDIKNLQKDRWLNVSRLKIIERIQRRLILETTKFCKGKQIFNETFNLQEGRPNKYMTDKLLTTIYI